MLEQYIRNYFLNIGLKNQYADELKPQEDGSFLLLFDTRIICSVEEQHEEENTVFVFSMVLNTEELSKSELLEKYAYFSNRLNLSPLARRAKLFILQEKNAIGLTYTISCISLEQQEFNQAVTLLAKTAVFMAGDSNVYPTAENYPYADSTQRYQKILSSLNLSLEDLRNNFNRLDFKDGFGVLLEFHQNAGVLKLTNVLDCAPSEDDFINLLSFNAEQNTEQQFNIQAGRLFIEQSLDLMNADAKRFYFILERQRMLVEKLNNEFSAVIKQEQGGNSLDEMMSNLSV
ncbi:hypothetical protein SAMN02745213_00600 [Succinivibrio dextrinosolvens DSM 3072]|uniref:Uncharacterized protein n=1 Tax=Succinivibrio dextrinosolvens DSM 3072 TaxID=1123324 RepID=A0A1T4V2B2_9GAMM|nr:hypothetical protein [Succinivibrio dextrinosolvens]SKA59090.1 hypothetical protein SAMN02745213_00600 [Succinivibrio dextrinosolvens DSM 3072]